MSEDFSDKKKQDAEKACKFLATFLFLTMASTLIAFVWGAGLWGFLMWTIIWACFGLILGILMVIASI